MSTLPEPLPDFCASLVDDAAIFPPGEAPLPDATAAHTARRAEPWADLVGPFVLRDTDLPLVRGFPGRLSVVLTGGAGQLAGPIGLAARLGLEVAAVEVALRDPGDPAGNARRLAAAVDAARGDGLLPEATPVYVELPADAGDHGWRSAADEVAAADLRLKLRTGGLDAAAFPATATLAGWIDAALDRETAFKCTAGLHHAVRHEDPEGRWWEHGFLNVLLATHAALEDGAGAAAEVLDRTDGAALGSEVRELSEPLTRARRWFTSFGSCSVEEPLADLRDLGLVA